MNEEGRLVNPETVCPYGQYSNVVDSEGNLYVADGEIFVYGKDGKEKKRIRVEERPISLAIGGKQKSILFVTTTRSLYGIRIK